VAESKRKFHQFPLALLAYGKDPEEKLDAMIAVGTVTAGIGVEQKLGGKEVALGQLDGQTWPDFDPQKWDHRAWALGRHVVNWSWHDGPHPCVTYYKLASRFLSAFGKSPLVRIGSDLLGEAKKRLFEFRDFSVLLAVYAIIGDKAYAIVRRDRVRAGALGYSSASALFDSEGKLTGEGSSLLIKRQDQLRPLTTNQIRYTLDRLHDRKFFCRIQPKRCGRAVYFSRSLSHDGLAEKLIARLERKAGVPEARRQAELKVQERAGLLKVAVSRDKSSLSPDVPQTVPAGVPALIPASLLVPSNSCPPNYCEGTTIKEGFEKLRQELEGSPCFTLDEVANLAGEKGKPRAAAEYFYRQCEKNGDLHDSKFDWRARFDWFAATEGY
jgi:hypothetical protein